MIVALVISVAAAVYILYTVVTMRNRERAGVFPNPPRRSRVPARPKDIVNPEFRFDDPPPGDDR